jgi:hypothetical protein
MENGVACPNCGCGAPGSAPGAHCYCWSNSGGDDQNAPMLPCCWCGENDEEDSICAGNRAHLSPMSGQDVVQREDERAASRAANSAGRRR